MPIIDELRAWASSQWFANLNSPSSYKRFVQKIVRRFVLDRWPGEPAPRILDHGGTWSFKDRASELLPKGTVLCIVNPGLAAAATYRDLAQVPADFNAHLIMVFGTIEYYKTSQALDHLIQQLFGLSRPGGTLLISETDPDAGVGALFGGLGHRIDASLTGQSHWKQGDVMRSLTAAGFDPINREPDLIPNVLGGANPVWVLSARRPG